MSERDVIERTKTPNTIDSLSAELRTLGVVSGMVLLVHSSLSALGWVCGGAVAVIRALERALGPKGTLVMPAMSGDLTDPRDWQHPPVPESWKDTIRSSAPPYDRNLTPTRSMGAIAEAFRTKPGVVRSDHPHCSFAAQGPHAEQITSGHELDFGLGEGSPLARIYELDGWILLLGVGHANNSSLHLAEYRTEYPGKRESMNGAPVTIDGARCWVEIRDLDLDESDFETIGEAFERETGQARTGTVGLATTRLLAQRALVGFAGHWMAEHRTAA
ncbi:aminoglycoside N(3)-acetyltransferase [Candidatus Bipolaricaulota bacterium]